MTDTEGATFYNVKIVNPMKRSDYFVRKWRTRIHFQSVESLQDELRGELDNHAEAFEVGYIEPGNGARGKQRWTLNDDDP